MPREPPPDPAEIRDDLLDLYPEMVDAITARDFETISDLLAGEPSERGPLLHQWWRAGWLDDPKRLSPLLLEAWRGPRYPTMSLEDRDWLDLFKAVGFIGFDFTDGAAIPPPSRPLLLYRGVGPSRSPAGMAWTEDLETAREFANSADNRSAGVVYRALVPPRAVLAIFRDKEENEVVVDPRELNQIEVAEPADPTVTRQKLEKSRSWPPRPTTY